MASPFGIFRKHQKAFLAVAAVLAMIIFVFADLLTSAISSSGGENKRLAMTVASWDGGSMAGRELSLLAERRNRISRFLARLQQAGAQRLTESGGTPLQPQVPNLILSQNLNSLQVHGGCINTRILSQLAKEAGISVSDQQINGYLKELSFGQLGGDEIINVLTRGNQANRQQQVEQLFAGLRELLLGNTYITSYYSALECVTPEERWQDWKRVNERISVVATVLPAEQFVSKVPDPTEVELRQFYDEFKNQVGGLKQWAGGRPLPSPDPGFMVPRRVRLQYLLADVGTRHLDLLESVTETEILDFYEKNKAQMFVKGESTASEAVPDDSPQQESKGDEINETGEESSRDDANAKDLSGNGEAETSAEDEEKADEYEPLDKVRDLIRRQLAQQKAALALEADIEKAASQLQKEYRFYGPDLAEAKEQGVALPPPPENLTDLAALAKETGLAHEKTALLSQAQLAETFVGKATQSFVGKEEDEEDGQSRTEMVARAMFDPSRALYEPFLAKDLGGSWYLVVKTEEQPARVPPLDEIRDEVIDAWKLRQAARLAIEEAEKLAAEAESTSESLDILLAGKPYETETTDMFSWLDFGSIPLEYLQYSPRRPQLSDAPPLESVGTEFMEKAFGLEPGQVAAVLNHDQTNAYLIRLAKRERSKDELQQQFLAEANTSVAGYIMTQMRFEEAHQALVNQLMSRVDLDIDQLPEFFRPSEEE